MQFDIVKEKVKGVPFITADNALELYNFIIKNKLTNILELGIAHGTASCYMAAALDELGGGKLTCVDLIDAANDFIPSIETQISGLGLNKYVEVHRMKSGYNWFLHNEIVACSNNANNICVPKYDLIIIDGPKNWTIDSSSFFLADKLLKENGWIIWDDYNWTYANVNTKREATDGIKHSSMADDEQQIPHIKEIFHLLVMQHPNYGNFQINKQGDWAWANKVKQEVKTVKFYTTKTLSTVVLEKLNAVTGKVKKMLK